MSMVSVSLRASLPHEGQSTSQKVEEVSNGLPCPLNETSSGSSTGNCSTGTGTGPQSEQWMIGIGVPQ
ncbi:MAG: hypothetical protein QGF72_04745, partial [Candidatus Poseidoniaceae archaeon]|nr:hypothetical protein [Candidatus Poseidoniaceae archaeon]